MKKIEFSKVLTLIAVITMLLISIWSITEYYALTKLAISTGASVLPDSVIPVTCITVILASILSYCLYQFGLKNSRNKYGIDENGEPYVVKLNEEQTEELCSTFNREDWPIQTPVDCDYKGE